MIDGWPIFYGVCVFVMLAITWVSKDHVAQKLGLCLLASWSTTQLANALFSLEGTPLVMPSMQVGLAIVVAFLGYANRSRLALMIFVLYGVLIGIHMMAWITQRTGDRGYFESVNVVFLSQVLIVGGAGGARVVRRWLLWGGERFGSLRSNGG